MDVIVLIGRILFGAVFVSSAVGHFTKLDAMAGYAESKGIKPGRPAVILSGAWALIGAILVIVGAWADLGALMLAVFVLPTAFIMHAFWKETDPAQRFNEQTHFHKDLSLGGAALAFFGLFASCCDQLGLMATHPLF